MFRYQKFIINQQERENMERKEKVEDHQKAGPVIAIIDTGVNVNHECFQDEGIPLFISEDKWKGGEIKIPYKRKILKLENYSEHSSNATSYLNDSNFAEDLNGHGTACASIAAAASTNLEWLGGIRGINSTVVQGANPYARIASYKIQGDMVKRLDDEENIKLLKANLLAAIKQAIVDKVDVIMVSLAAVVDYDTFYLHDVINYGAYLAMKENIILCKSAGNDGVVYGLTGGLAPWVVTVGSCNSGGRFITQVELGNTSKLKGFDSFMEEDGHNYELIHCSECFKKQVAKKDIKGKEIAKVPSEEKRKRPEELEINREVVEGKIVCCNEQIQGFKIQFLNANAVGLLIVGRGNEFKSYDIGKPVVYVSEEDGRQIEHYIRRCRLSNTKPIAKILKSAYEENEEIYKLSKKSSKGPNPYDSYILKPDICAPGENILCANKWSPKNMYADYCIMSGTSIANAVVAGMISKIMLYRKEWKPGRIKSAIMTTAMPMEPKQRADPLGCGAGCINPVKAVDPGLVYDVTLDDFRRYILSHEKDKEFLSSVGENVSGEVIFGMNLNLPSFSLMLRKTTPYIFDRMLTNVGPNPTCIYKANIFRSSEEECPSYVKIAVKPRTLKFNGIGDKKHFQLTIESPIELGTLIAHARLIWTEQSQEAHRVSSPIVIMHPDVRKLRKGKAALTLSKKRSAGQIAQSSKQKILKSG